VNVPPTYTVSAEPVPSVAIAFTVPLGEGFQPSGMPPLLNEATFLCGTFEISVKFPPTYRRPSTCAIE